MTLPTIILPGYLAGAESYRGMEQGLHDLGIAAITVPLRRRDWLPTLGGRSMLPILGQLDQTVKRVIAETGSDRINLVGHSAGGWIARIYLGGKSYSVHPGDAGKVCLWEAYPLIKTLVTLGTPHISQERWTKRNLDFVKTNYPGAFYPSVRYVCVAGKAVYGQRNWQGWFTYSSYELTCGLGECWGDGVTPVEAAHLEGAENLTLAGVMHSPRPGVTWYGSPEPLQTWAAYLL